MGVFEELDVLDLLIVLVGVTDEVPVIVPDLVGVIVFDGVLEGVPETLAVLEDVIVFDGLFVGVTERVLD